MSRAEGGHDRNHCSKSSGTGCQAARTRHELGAGGIEPRASHLTHWGAGFTGRCEEQLPDGIDQGGSRTHNHSVLSAAPLPVGLPGRDCGERDSNPHKQVSQTCASAVGLPPRAPSTFAARPALQRSRWFGLRTKKPWSPEGHQGAIRIRDVRAA